MHVNKLTIGTGKTRQILKNINSESATQKIMIQKVHYWQACGGFPPSNCSEAALAELVKNSHNAKIPALTYALKEIYPKIKNFI